MNTHDQVEWPDDEEQWSVLIELQGFKDCLKLPNDKCDECECNHVVWLIPDPFDQDINNQENLRWLCRHCYTTRLHEI